MPTIGHPQGTARMNGGRLKRGRRPEAQTHVEKGDMSELNQIYWCNSCAQPFMTISAFESHKKFGMCK